MSEGTLNTYDEMFGGDDVCLHVSDVEINPI